jgi:hypothetical protein
MPSNSPGHFLIPLININGQESQDFTCPLHTRVPLYLAEGRPIIKYFFTFIEMGPHYVAQTSLKFSIL